MSYRKVHDAKHITNVYAYNKEEEHELDYDLELQEQQK